MKLSDAPHLAFEWKLEQREDGMEAMNPSCTVMTRNAILAGDLSLGWYEILMLSSQGEEGWRHCT